MKPYFGASFLMAAALLVGAGVAGAADNHAPKPQTDASLTESIRHAVVMYPRYSIFDDLYVQVENGNVHVSGVVSQPFKKSDLDKIVRSVAGDRPVQDDVRVLPLSANDEQLRLRVARSIYGDMTMTKYAIQPLKPIHIIVENGHVTLTGVVATNFDKQIAGTRAATAGMSFGPVVNNLQVENPPKKS
jgi:hyperosmotically inducible periplasmic protein